MLNRRDFCMRLLTLPAVTSNLDFVLHSASPEFDTAENGFPVGDFTPFGYLDNPFHSWNLHRSGILRSSPGIGFGFYFPAGPGGYFDYAKNGIYEAHLRLGFFVGGRRFWMPKDFRAGQLSSPYHSKNIFTYAFAEESTQVECTFLQVGEDVLAARIAVKGAKPQSVRVLAVLESKLGGAAWWGRDGLAGEYDSASDALWIRSFAAGKVFTILGDSPTERHFVGETDTDLDAWFDSGPNVEKGITYFPKPLWGALQFKLDVIPGEKSERTLILARAENAEVSTAQARASLAKARDEHSAKLAEDLAFWKTAPVLEGDWPAHWKHGWVYDFETLRMIVRRPVGNFKHRWDAMQIQAPRTVLAETSIDMLALSYADPATAKAVFLGLFLNAASDNVPCARENGEMNMVAVDGSECGTSISWCYPFFCARSIWSRSRDKQWLAAVYPHLVRLLRWTLKNRTDSEQFVTGKCSWETGMDAATRFLIQQSTGGELIEFLRIVELQAATAQAAKILGQFAEVLGEETSVAEWDKTYQVYAAKTQTLWKDDWFYDYDTRNGKLVTTVSKDVGQVAPVFCGIATNEQIGKMRPTLRKFFAESATTHLAPADDWQDELHWSSLVLPYLESLRVAGELELLSQVVHAIAERVYTSTDRRSLTGDSSGDVRAGSGTKQKLGWPGVSCEIWGAEGAYGGEGYGWGAVLPAHIIRNLIGFRDPESPDELRLAPNLPEALMVTDKMYRVRNLQFSGGSMDLGIQVLDSRRVRIQGRLAGSVRIKSVKDASGTSPVLQGSGSEWQFEGLNRTDYWVRVARVSAR
ncbi:MAG TPA: trehalase family glycosidase [Candidatus Limnocylindrales bacterium]|nr:trehalase family glycosidase [Candidatus Limnocylindrales bacterium]